MQLYSNKDVKKKKVVHRKLFENILGKIYICSCNYAFRLNNKRIIKMKKKNITLSFVANYTF